MDVKKTVTMTIAIAVAVIVTSGVLVPVISEATGSTVTIEQEGASWIRLAKVDTDYTVDYSIDGGNLTAGDQTGEATDMICYADDNNTLCVMDGVLTFISPNSITRYNSDVQIVKSNGILSVNGTEYTVSENA